MGIGIKPDAAVIGIPVSDISVRYRSIPVPDWVPLLRYRTGTDIGILFHLVPDWPDAGRSGIFKNCRKEERGTPCTSTLLTLERDTPILHFHPRLLMVLNLLYDVDKSYVKAGRPRKSSPESKLWPVIGCVSSASAFRNRGQSSTAGHGLVRYCPAMVTIFSKKIFS